MTDPSQPVPRPGARTYVLTRAGNAAAIRAELDDVTLDLVALDQGTKSWDQVYPDLTNGDRQQQAINLAWERMTELQQALRDAEGEKLGMTEAKPAGIAEALNRLQAELKPIRRNTEGQVGQRKRKYADLAAVTEAVYPLLGKYGLSFSAKPTLKDGRFVLAYKLRHVSGEEDAGDWPLSGGGSQQIGSELTYARRYCLCAITGAAPEGEDDDGHEAEADWRSRPPVNRGTQDTPDVSQWEDPAPEAEPNGQPRVVTDDKWLAEIKAEIAALKGRDYGEVLFRRVHEKVEAKGCTVEDGKALQADITEKVAALGKAAKRGSPGDGHPSPDGKRREEVPA